MNENIKTKTKQESIDMYKAYIDRHIANVKKAFKFYGEELCKRLNIDYERLKYQVEHHDEDKYIGDEFEGYRLFFYESEEDEKEFPFEEEINRRFMEAWECHVINNPHHPEFWVYQDPDTLEYGVKDMDLISLAEMLLDWAAMSVMSKSYPKNTAYDYFMKEGKDKPFTNTDIENINTVIDIFK